MYSIYIIYIYTYIHKKYTSIHQCFIPCFATPVLPGLLCSDDGFLAASWIKDAIRWAAGNATLQRYFEMAARSVTTVWTPQERWGPGKMAR